MLLKVMFSTPQINNLVFINLQVFQRWHPDKWVSFQLVQIEITDIPVGENKRICYSYSSKNKSLSQNLYTRFVHRYDYQISQIIIFKMLALSNLAGYDK